MTSVSRSYAFGVLARTVSSLIAIVIFAFAPALLCQESMEAEEAPAESSEAVALDESLRAVVELPFERELFEYVKEGRRDPFLPLVPKEEGAEPNVNNLTLTGIIWGFSGNMAVVKEKGATGHVLRQGDKVSGGRVENITRDSITFRLSEYGIVTRYTLTLKGEGRK